MGTPLKNSEIFKKYLLGKKKNIGKLQKLEGIVGTMIVTIYMVLKTEFLVHIK